MKSLQQFVSVHANGHNHFNLERHLIDRQTYKTTAPPPWPSGSPSWPEAWRNRGELCLAETSCGSSDSAVAKLIAN